MSTSSFSDATVQVKNKYGEIHFGWKHRIDLELEEDDEDYLPKQYTKILELRTLAASKLGAGYGEKLMTQFLSTNMAREAELIFLDPAPETGLFYESKIPEEEQFQKLLRFYGKFGFRHNPKSRRMWLVKEGHIQTSKLPT